MKMEFILHYLVIAVMGVQLVVLSGCASQPTAVKIKEQSVVANTPQVTFSARMGSAKTRKLIYFASPKYAHIVNDIVAHHLRIVRVEEEQKAAAKSGHPVALPIGKCSATLTVAANGDITGIHMGRCTSPALEYAEREAIGIASPLPPPGQILNVVVNTSAPVAIPGLYGN